MSFETAMETALNVTITGTIDEPDHAIGDSVFISADYDLADNSNSNYVRTVYQVTNIVIKWDGTKVLDKGLVDQADGSGTAVQKMWFFEIKNQSGITQIRHESELILIAAVRTNVGTDINTAWNDTFTAS